MLLKANQGGSGGDLCLYLMDVYHKAALPVDIRNKARLLYLLREFPEDEPTIKRFVSEMIGYGDSSYKKMNTESVLTSTLGGPRNMANTQQEIPNYIMSPVLSLLKVSELRSKRCNKRVLILGQAAKHLMPKDISP